MNQLKTMLAIGLASFFGMTVSTPAVHAEERESAMKVVGDVFLKGTVDGKGIFLVLGVQDGLKAIRGAAEGFIDGKDLADLGRDVYNADHEDDLVHAVTRGLDGIKETAPKILTKPWRSLKDIPKSFRVNLDNADEAYYKANSKAVAALKYGGWATWAVIEGLYYLVIEAPLEFVGYSVATAAVLPGSLALQSLVISWDIFKIAIKRTFFIAAGVTIGAYSLVSSSVATVCTAVVSGTVAACRGIKYVLYELPRSHFYPVQVRYETTQPLEDQEKLANSVSSYFTQSGFTVDATIGKYKSRMKITKAGEAYANVYVYPERNKLILFGEMSKKYVKSRKALSPEISYRETIGDLSAEITTHFQAIQPQESAPVQPVLADQPHPQPAPEETQPLLSSVELTPAA